MNIKTFCKTQWYTFSLLILLFKLPCSTPTLPSRPLFLWPPVLCLEFPSSLAKYGLSVCRFPVKYTCFFPVCVFNSLWSTFLHNISYSLYWSTSSLSSRLVADWSQYFLGIPTHRRYSRKLVWLSDIFAQWGNWLELTDLMALE